MAATLIAFPPSLDSELVRFLLAYYGIPYTEERHALLFCPFVTLRRGRSILFPLLLNENARMPRARDVVDAFDPRSPMGRRLLRDGAEGEIVEADWRRFNEDLGFATATFSYYHLLKHRDIMLRPLSEGVPNLERRSVELAYPLYANTLRALLVLTPWRAQASLDKVRTIVDAVDRRLSDQRRYLVGDRFSLSDMAFSVALAPLVLPDTYGGPLPTLLEMPSTVSAAIEEMRQHPAGQFALRIYRQHRQEQREADGAVRVNRTVPNVS